jgi:hypothetical protein
MNTTGVYETILSTRTLGQISASSFIVSSYLTNEVTLTWGGTFSSVRVLNTTTNVFVDKDSSTLSADFSGLVANTSYTFSVTPYNATGGGSGLGVAGTAQTVVARTLPTLISATSSNITTSGVRISWTGSFFSSVRVLNTTTNVFVDKDSSTLSADFSGLVANTSYTFSVTPYNATGGGSGSGVAGAAQLVSVTTTSATLSFTQLLASSPPWGRYSAANFSGTSLTDLTGNGRHGVITGSYTTGNESGNGASASIAYMTMELTGTSTTLGNGVTFNNGTTVVWPDGSIPTTYTICAITRYDPTLGYRILGGTERTNDLIIGHYNSTRGVVYATKWITNSTTKGSAKTNWLPVCVKKTTLPNNVLVDKVAVGIANNDGNVGGSNKRLGINVIEPAGKCHFSHLIIWDIALSDTELVTVSNSFDTYLSTGTMQ